MMQQTEKPSFTTRVIITLILHYHDYRMKLLLQTSSKLKNTPKSAQKKKKSHSSKLLTNLYSPRTNSSGPELMTLTAPPLPLPPTFTVAGRSLQFSVLLPRPLPLLPA